MPEDIDVLTPTRSLIDLKAHSQGDWGLDNFVLSKVFCDIILVEFIDITGDDEIERNGIVIPTNAQMTAWRKGRVLLKGPDVDYCDIDDIVIFPNDKGATIANVEIETKDGPYKVSSGMFLNQQRLFGVCSPADESK